MTTLEGFSFFRDAALLLGQTEIPPLAWTVLVMAALGVGGIYASLRYLAPPPEQLAEEAEQRAQAAAQDPTLLGRDAFEELVLDASIPSLVRVVANGHDDDHLAQILAQVQGERNQGFQIGAVRASTIEELIEEKRGSKHLQDTFQFERFPQLALFRNGELVTTLDPYYDNDLTTVADMKRRIRSFLIKMGV